MSLLRSYSSLFYTLLHTNYWSLIWGHWSLLEDEGYVVYVARVVASVQAALIPYKPDKCQWHTSRDCQGLRFVELRLAIQLQGGASWRRSWHKDWWESTRRFVLVTLSVDAVAISFFSMENVRFMLWGSFKRDLIVPLGTNLGSKISQTDVDDAAWRRPKTVTSNPSFHCCSLQGAALARSHVFVFLSWQDSIPSTTPTVCSPTCTIVSMASRENWPTPSFHKPAKSTSTTTSTGF